MVHIIHVPLSYNPYLCLSFKLPLSLYVTTSVSVSRNLCFSFKLLLSLYLTTVPMPVFQTTTVSTNVADNLSLCFTSYSCPFLTTHIYLCLSFKQPLSLFFTTSVSLSNCLCLSFKLHLSLHLITSVFPSKYLCLSLKLPLSLFLSSYISLSVSVRLRCILTLSGFSIMK